MLRLACRETLPVWLGHQLRSLFWDWKPLPRRVSKYWACCEFTATDDWLTHLVDFLGCYSVSLLLSSNSAFFYCSHEKVLSRHIKPVSESQINCLFEPCKQSSSKYFVWTLQPSLFLLCCSSKNTCSYAPISPLNNAVTYNVHKFSLCLSNSLYKIFCHHQNRHNTFNTLYALSY